MSLFLSFYGMGGGDKCSHIYWLFSDAVNLALTLLCMFVLGFCVKHSFEGTNILFFCIAGRRILNEKLIKNIYIDILYFWC